MPSAALELRHITKQFTQGDRLLTVLSDIELVIKRNELVALVGPSGAGKSTLLQIAGLLDSPTQGEVWINQQDASHLSEKAQTQMRKAHIGFVYQFHHLLPEFTALENAMMPLLIAGTKRSDAEKQASSMLSSLGLQDRLTHRPAELSGGEQQRVAIARALVHQPALLLADEPTGNLDPVTSAHVLSMFIERVRAQEVGMLIVTHNEQLAKQMDRVLRLEQGKLTED